MVEDQRDILEPVLKHLRSNGFVPNGFTDPIDALEEFKVDPKRYWLVLTDVKMPRMSGIELAREILRVNPQTEIVLMTAYEYFEDEIRSDLPIVTHDDIIQKPFRLTEICARVKQHVRTTR